MKITHIIFDLGNVILTNDWHSEWPEKFREYSDYFGVSYDDMEKGWHTFWPQFSLGKITEEEFWSGFLNAADAKIIDIEHAKRLWRKYQRPIENMLDLLGRLKKYYKLAALTTISKEWLDYKKNKYNLDNYFNIIVSSGYSGLAKPDPKIYDLIIQQLRVDPQECLFVDDNERTLPPAKSRGMEVILFKSQQRLEKELRESGIKF